MVLLFDNDTTIVDTLIEAPYTAVLPSLASGEHNVEAMAFDMDGDTLWSNAVAFTVDEGYPHVTINTPGDQAIFNPGASISIEADAYDTDGTIDSVVFHVNDTWLATDTESPYTASIESPEIGVNQIRVVAWDNDRKSTEIIIQVEVGAILTLQEEEAGFCGFTNGSGSIDSNHEDHTGSGFANSDNVSGVQINWAVDIPVTGNYKLAWRYACTEARPGDLYIDSVLVGTAEFKNTGDWALWDEVSLNAEGVEAGLRRIILEASESNGLPNIDYLKVISLSTDLSAEAGDCSLLPGLNSVNEQKMEDAGSFMLYPVPASRELYLRFSDSWTEIRHVTVFGIDGRRVMEMEGTGTYLARLDIQGLDKGIYLIRIDTGTRLFSCIFTVTK
jgi:hypothetical protein